MRSAVLCVVILASHPAAAQIPHSTQMDVNAVIVRQSDGSGPGVQRPRDPRMFVTGAVLADIDELDYRPGGGPVPAGAIGIGLRLSPKYDLRGELEIPGWHRHYDGAQGPPVTSEDNTATRTPVLAILLARYYGQQPNIILMLGGSFLAHAYRSSGFWHRVNADGSVAQHDTWDLDIADYRWGLSLGIDVPFRLRQRLAFGPQLRVHRLVNGHFGDTLPRGYFAIRGGVAIRLDF